VATIFVLFRSTTGQRKRIDGAPLQLPKAFRKNPVAHLAQAVPLSAVVHPGLQLHELSAWQVPCKQLHLEAGLSLAGGLGPSDPEHFPVPAIPSSHPLHPAGHGVHLGPKNPLAQDSHALPVKPLAHTHSLVLEQRPAEEQGGEQTVDPIPKST
jgi:hypothetical protein